MIVAMPAVARRVMGGALPVVEHAVTSDDAGEWDTFVASRDDAHGYHEWAWGEVITRAFGHGRAYLMARDAQGVSGVLPLVEMNSALFGRFLTSLPFLNYGGLLAASPEAALALVDAARELGRERKCRHVELRHVTRCLTDVPVRQHKVTMRLALAPGMWDRFDRKVRNQIRKAEKSGLTAERGGVELLADFYQVFAHNMRDLGTPVCGRRFFAEVLEAFDDRARIVVVRRGEQPVACALTYRTRTTTEIPWASSLRSFNPLCPNHLMYWSAIQWALDEGCSTFDFGRSTPHEGTYNFKSQWGAEPTDLHWEYPYLAHGQIPDQSPRNPKFQAAIATWKRLPLWMANAVGPHIARTIP